MSNDNVLKGLVVAKHQSSTLSNSPVNVRIKTIKDNFHPNDECREVTVSYLSTHVEYYYYNNPKNFKQIECLKTDPRATPSYRYRTITESWRLHNQTEWVEYTAC